MIGPTAAGVRFAVASSVISAGAVMAGAFVSCTVTIIESLPILPEQSVASTVTVVAPSGYVPIGAILVETLQHVSEALTCADTS